MKFKVILLPDSVENARHLIKNRGREGREAREGRILSKSFVLIVYNIFMINFFPFFSLSSFAYIAM